METNERTENAEIVMEASEAAPVKSRAPLMVAAAIILIIGGGIAAIAFAGVSSQRVYIEKSSVEAPQIALAPTTSGTLKETYVAVGDTIEPNAVVAQVDTELVKATSGGLVISTNDNIGSLVSPQTPVVTMIDPTALRVVGQIDENKGLADIKVGDRALFTVDAFGGKKYEGVVDEISSTSNNSDVVFSVSDKRETRAFDVKVAFDREKYPELKNGMSARIWVYTK